MRRGGDGSERIVLGSGLGIVVESSVGSGGKKRSVYPYEESGGARRHGGRVGRRVWRAPL